MTITVELPGGGTAEFPDGTPPAVMLSAVRSYVAGQQRQSEARGIGRWLGLAGRAVAQGVTGLPSAAIEAIRDPLGGQRIGRAVAQRFTGEAPPIAAPTLGEGVTAGLDAIGVPSPTTPSEQWISAGIQGAAGALPMMGLGLAAAPETAARAFLSGNPLSQLAAGATGGIAAQQAEAAGYGPAAQLLAGTAGGIGGAAAAQGARAAGNALTALVQPFRQSGREAMAADVLMRSSSDPATLTNRLAAGVADADRRLPGAPVTTAQAARDPALLMTENSVRQGAIGPVEAARLRDADAARNAARNAAIAGMADASDPAARGAAVRGAVSAQEQARRGVVSRAYKAIDPEGATAVSLSPIGRGMFEAANRRFGPGSGGPPAEVAALLEEVRGAGPRVTFEWLDNMSKRLGEETGKAAMAGNARAAATFRDMRAAIEAGVERAAQRRDGFTPEQVARWNAATALRRQMGEDFGRDATGTNVTGAILATDRFGRPLVPDERAVAAALASPNALAQTLRAAGGRAEPVREALRGQFVENMLGATRATSDVLDSAGNTTRQLSAAQFRRFWDRNAPIAAQIFDRREMDLLRRLSNDFAETAAALNTGTTRNSQTVQNMSVGNLIARATSGLVDPTNPLAQTLGGMGGMLRFLYRPSEDMMRDMLAHALADPQFAAALLSRATPENIRRAASYIDRNVYGRVGTAAATGVRREVIRTIGRQATPPQE